MFIKQVEIKNFRLLKDVSLSLDNESTVIVGRNNSGKTSLTEIFRRLFSVNNPVFKLEDFSLASIASFKKAFDEKQSGKSEPTIRALIPIIELTLIIEYDSDLNDLGALSDFIIDLDEKSTVAKLKFSYQLKDGKIDSLFEEISGSDDVDFFKKLQERIPKLFTTIVRAIDPTNNENTLIVDHSKLCNLIDVDFINAQRGLNDETQTEKDVLGKVLSSIFKNASLESAPTEMKQKSQELESVVNDIQGKLDKDFKEKVDALLPALKIFGYPGLSDPKLSTETSFNIPTLLERNTKIKYFREEGISLPETYNGLGSRNLIYILFQLFEFFRKYQSNPIERRNHIVFIEEPEAHLHPQMQEVFIRQLHKIAEEFSNSFNNSKPWPVQFVVSTHSTHIANEANFESIRYFLTVAEKQPETRIKDLKDEFKSEDRKEDKDFIHKYLTLTRCDLFFADKAMLIEGTTERLLMPILIKKIDEEKAHCTLADQYISVVEIGGAYAHHFYKFLDFIELRTLIITDLDSTLQQKNNEGQIIYKACEASKGTHTSNAGIVNWYENEKNINLSVIKRKTVPEKIKGTRRIAFQIPETGRSACGRSFEDAFILANRELFDINKLDESVAEEDAYQEAEKIKKTNFALEYAIHKTKWEVPQYIKEGLIWLSENSLEKKGDSLIVTPPKDGSSE